MPEKEHHSFSKPRHVAIIMDGNGRWAKQRGLPRLEGHRQGVKNVERVLKSASELGLEVLTLYAFSSENWSRPKSEVDGLMGLLERFLTDREPLLHKHRIRLRTIGRKRELPANIVDLLNRVEDNTGEYKKTLGLALNYGSRMELLDAVRRYTLAVRDGTIPAEDEPTWEVFSGFLYTAGLPDPDLIIRTSGEKRLSNFLLLQAAYAEIHYSQVNWPDFDHAAFLEAINDFRGRERRFGLTSEQLPPEE